MKKLLLATVLMCLCMAASVFAAPTYGDADNDGNLTAADAALVLQKVLNSSFSISVDDEYVDVDGDGSLTAADAAMILQKVLNASYVFPVEETTENTTESTTESTTEITTESTTETTTESTTETTTESTTETTTETTTQEDYGVEIADFPEDCDYSVSVSTYTELRNAVTNATGLYENAVIYVTDDISANSQFKLSRSNANISIVGVQKADGTYPAIDFAAFRDSVTSTGESGTGVYVSGNHYNFKNLFIQNAPDCGMRIKGSSAGNCIIENVVFRYNNNSGLSITAGGANNTVKCCDSYRNCDLVQKLGSDADGFSIKLSAGDGNLFYNCRAWENGDDGWDSYNHTGNLTYIECLCWHNGDADVFSGKYDYDNNQPLDKNLIYVQALIENDADFETKYNDRTITDWPNVKVTMGGTTINGSSINNDSWDGNPNGFKFGSATVPVTAERYMRNCIAYGHGAKGFDQNNAACTIDMANTVGYDNGYQDGKNNYMMGNMTATKFDNCVSFNGANPDELPTGSGIDVAVIEPDEEVQQEIREIVETKFDSIKNDLSNNIIPGEVLFDVFDLTK